jgi:hypothetical protein
MNKTFPSQKKLQAFLRMSSWKTLPYYECFALCLAMKSLERRILDWIVTGCEWPSTYCNVIMNFNWMHTIGVVCLMTEVIHTYECITNYILVLFRTGLNRPMSVPKMTESSVCHGHINLSSDNIEIPHTYMSFPPICPYKEHKEFNVIVPRSLTRYKHFLATALIRFFSCKQFQRN